jgi:peptidoglycan-associated lipoprotein
LCLGGRCVAITPEVELAECAEIRVHFDYDAWLLHPDDKPRLDRVARCLRADHGLHVTIEGNADERGTEEYNLQLGAKRASQVERYLEALGASSGQLKSVSYGFEKPVCTEHNEGCWSQNRRAGLAPVPAAQ